MKERIIVALSGASGMIYAIRLIQWLIENNYPLDLLMSAQAKKILKLETGKFLSAQADFKKFFKDQKRLIKFHSEKDFNSPLASGSARRKAMIIIPCSMGLVGRIANGISSNLIERSADVMLKEKRPLVIAFREAPLNLIHLENLTKLSRAGAVIVPLSPGFYFKPKNIEELISPLVGRILRLVGIENQLEKEWGNGQG